MIKQVCWGFWCSERGALFRHLQACLVKGREVLRLHDVKGISAMALVARVWDISIPWVFLKLKVSRI